VRLEGWPRALTLLGGSLSDGAYVYILLCADESYYTGTAGQSLEQRVAEHNAGRYDGYTPTRRLLTLVFSQWFERITDAIAAERQIKGWSRAKKEALIRGDFEALQILATRLSARR
jgi:putative endonuclease